jgi:hypothetical protein
VKWNNGTDNYGQFNPPVPLRLLYHYSNADRIAHNARTTNARITSAVRITNAVHYRRRAHYQRRALSTPRIINATDYQRHGLSRPRIIKAADYQGRGLSRPCITSATRISIVTRICLGFCRVVQ